MMSYEKLKKVKFLIKKNSKILSAEDIQSLIDKTQNTSIKHFLIALKHITERHYTEAIKWLQISNCKDSPLLIAALSFKLADQFLYEEYINEDMQEDCLKRLGLNIYLKIDSTEIPVNTKTVKDLPKVIL